jgi:hypothetical protein
MGRVSLPATFLPGLLFHGAGARRDTGIRIA